jgi:hypothetical protein
MKTRFFKGFIHFPLNPRERIGFAELSARWRIGSS